jgi:hypothetical protein
MKKDPPWLYGPLRTLASFIKNCHSSLARHTSLGFLTQAYTILRYERIEVVNLTPKPQLGGTWFTFCLVPNL